MKISPVAIGITLTVIVYVLFSLKWLRRDERAVIFRIGRARRVVGPGIVVVWPVLERMVKVNLQEEIPHWQHLSGADLNKEVMDLVISGKAKAVAAAIEAAKQAGPAGLRIEGAGFVFEVEDVFEMSAALGRRQTVCAGSVSEGDVQLGDSVVLRLSDGTAIEDQIVRIEKSGGTVNSASKGEVCGIYLKETLKKDLH